MVRIDGGEAVSALKRAGATHAVWVPDSDLGTWEAALTGPDGLPLIRVCREGEAFAVAAGLWLGGKKPVLLLQCTGLFEAGDALRNVLHDMNIPLFLIVGVRSALAAQMGKVADTCPTFTEPILKAWQIPYRLLDLDNNAAAELGREFTHHITQRQARAVLIPE